MNFKSQEWAEVTVQVESAIAVLKEDICSHMLTAEQTAFKRGGIAYLRAFLRWPETEAAAAPQPIEGEDFGI